MEANYHLPITELLELVAHELKDNFLHYTGVYMYLLESEMLVLGPYRGKSTEHTRIPIGAGMCGRAARVKETVTVDDVTADADAQAYRVQFGNAQRDRRADQAR